MVLDLQTFKSVTRPETRKINILMDMKEFTKGWFLQCLCDDKSLFANSALLLCLKASQQKKKRHLCKRLSTFQLLKWRTDTHTEGGWMTQSCVLSHNWRLLWNPAVPLSSLQTTILSYLSHRHAAHTGVQHTRPCVGAHLTDEREPLLPADTVEMDRLPSEGNKGTFVSVGMDF